MKDYSTILFDLDGTLTDSGLGITNCVKYALSEMGRAIPGDDELKRFIGPPLVVSFRDYCDMSEEQAREAVRLYRVRYSDVGLFENTVYDGIEQMLKSLSDAGFTLAVATSKPEVFARRILEKFELAGFFSFIGGSGLDGTLDTKLEVIKYVLEKLKINDRSKALMVGDRHYDIDGARAAGISSMGVLFGYGTRDELEEAGADLIAASPHDIADLLI